jgi:hypothetical protein
MGKIHSIVRELVEEAKMSKGRSVAPLSKRAAQTEREKVVALKSAQKSSGHRNNGRAKTK